MSEVKLTAESRSEFGKGASRRLRRAGKVPAVLYGHGTAPVHVALDGHATMMALKQANVLLALDLGDKVELALPKSVQRDAVRGHIEHVDLILVRRGEKVSVDVPLQVTGSPLGNAYVVSDVSSLAVEAEATTIPDSLEISIDGAEPGFQIHAKDIALPAGVSLAVDPDLLIVTVAEQGGGAAEESEAAEA
ncbi:MAG: 50S ribosomal protein L25/general stress protein Ctc [Kineosporiaceae bacterium]